ncbi:hypothetical protein GCM10011514_41330 [Emticicia aquatilis]|uniref:Outer membrane protein beta-barrel domain-containing protein n=1 Tax=Emticicia aquatilis TaxID=1537369 RepID=A0A916Z2F1_9BACT|nr:hypothetical protein [Emticicia aquatilis]GGD72961.1 hypothetical protein GCM10011514_41330 [Emticicia aquatilis]
MKHTLCIIFFYCFIFSAHSQFNKNDLFISTGITINNFKYSKLPWKTYEFQPLQSLYLVNKNIGIGLSTNYIYKLVAGTTTYHDFVTYANVRGILNSSFFVKPYLQFSAGLGNYKITQTNIDRFSPNTPTIKEIWNANTVNYAPTIGTMISFSPKIGLDFNYQYRINNLKFKKPFFTTNEMTVKESKLNCSLFYKFNTK